MADIQPSATRRPPRLLFNLNFGLLTAGYFISAVGDNFNDPGQLKLMGALEGQDSVRLMALMMFGLFVPYVVLGPLAGAVADRFPRKWVMVVADLGRAALIINFTTLITFFRECGFGPYTVMCTQMLIGLLAAFFSPARQALVPAIVRSEDLVRANGLIGAAAPIGAMLGFLAGGWVVDRFSADWNFRINCVTYLMSAGLIVSIFRPAGPAPADHRPTSILGPLIAGFRYVLSHRRALELILLGALFWGAAGVVYSCIPALVTRAASGQYTEVGLYRAVMAIGMAAGSIAMTLLGPAITVRLAVIGGLILAALGLSVLAGVHHFALGRTAASACLLATGFAGTVLLVTITATLQRLVPDSRRGRVFGVSDMATMGAMILATGTLGIAPIAGLDRFVPIILLLTAGALLIASVWAVHAYRRHARHADASQPHVH